MATESTPERKEVSVLLSRKAMRPNGTNFAFRVLHFRKRIVVGLLRRGNSGIFPARAYYVRASKVFHAGGQLLPEGIRVIVPRPSGKERIRGEEKRKRTVQRYGPQDARHCFWRILDREHSRSFFPPRNYINWFLIAIDVVGNINRLPCQLCRALTMNFHLLCPRERVEGKRG